MYQDTGTRTLKSGETVSLAIVTGPEPDWAERLVGMLRHKGDPWNWQNAEMLMLDCGVAACFYVLHRNGVPFANVLTVTHRGVGIFGHVYTKPEDRKKGAAALLSQEVIEDFSARGGHALFLGTGYESPAYRIYERLGFRSIEARSGYMAWYGGGEEAFAAAYFAPAPADVRTVEWRHWPSACALFLGAIPGVVRCAPYRVFGRMSAESPLLPVVRAEAARRRGGETPRTLVLESQATHAVAGIAAWNAHPLWPDVCLVDVFCHPGFWTQAHELFGALALPQGERCIAYADLECPEKAKLLRAFGFRQTATLPQQLAIDHAKTRFTDVEVYEKR